MSCRKVGELMPTQTDPAKEIAEICDKIRSPSSNVAGANFLSEHFNVSAWSPEFYEIVFTIAKRISQLQELIGDLQNVDDDIRDQAIEHLSTILKAFSQAGLVNHWSHASTNFISAEHVNPIKMLSSEVRRVQTLPRLSEDEKRELLSEVDDLLLWLHEHQINENDFIRQAIIEGLESFRFRVERVSWVGWGYSLDSLRAVIGAYLALERGIQPTQQPDAQAVLMKVGAALKFVFQKVGVVKDTTEKAGWLIEGYKNISAAVVAGKGAIVLIAAAGGS